MDTTKAVMRFGDVAEVPLKKFRAKDVMDAVRQGFLEVLPGQRLTKGLRKTYTARKAPCPNLSVLEPKMLPPGESKILPSETMAPLSPCGLGMFEKSVAKEMRRIRKTIRKEKERQGVKIKGKFGDKSLLLSQSQVQAIRARSGGFVMEGDV